MDQELIDELRERIARLEASRRRPRAFNQQEAARELGMSVSKLRGLQKAGRIGGRLCGRVWTFTDADLETFLTAPSDDAAA
jgi:hypothetical protein